MSTPAVRKGRRRVWASLAAFAAVLGVFLSVGAGSASAVIDCTYDGILGVLTIEAVPPNENVDDEVTVRKSGGSPGAILVNGATCPNINGAGVAQVNNVDQIEVDLQGNDFSTSDGNTLTIDNTNGRVTEPGFTQNEADLNEIEWLLEDVDSVVYNDTEASGAITIGEFDPSGGDVIGAPPGGFYDGATEFSVNMTDPDCAGDIDGGDVLINMNAFPGDNDADLVECDNQISLITVNGNGGDDFILGKGGDGADSAVDENLILNGGDGVDEIEGGEDDDIITGGPGRDVLDGNSNDPVEADCDQNDDEGRYEDDSSGGDTVDFSGEAGPLTIVFNEDGSLTITVNPDATVVDFENVVGSAGNDTITGNSLGNVLSGGAGNDTISGGGGNDVLIGGDGDDTLAGDGGDDCVLGNAGNDILNENTGTATTNPGDGNGADDLDGGPGLDDVVDYSGRSTRVVIYLGIISWNNDGGDESADSISEECDDVFFSTENAIGGSGNDILSADFLNNQSDNELTGGAGNDQLEGGAGNDIFHEGTAANGSDAMEGDSGADLADYAGRTNGVTVSLNDGAGNDGEAGEGDSVGANVVSLGIEGICGEDHPDFLTGASQPNNGFTGDAEPFNQDEAEEAGTTNAQIENVAGGSGGDVLVGDAGANILTGNAGNDTLTGNGGSDVLSGGDGDDLLAGGPGNDALDGGAGTDWFDFQSAGAGGVGVQVNLTTGTATGEGSDALTGGENVGGSSFADTIRGDAGNNVLNGRGGNDAIQGQGGDDVINGGTGNDELNGNGGNDTVRGQGGADTVRGAGGDDAVKGDGGEDTVFGGAGDDNVFGGAGKDNLRGGPGTDRCRPGSPGLARGDHAIGCEA